MGRSGLAGKSKNTIWRMNLSLVLKEKSRSVYKAMTATKHCRKYPVTLNSMLSNTKLSWLFLKVLHNVTGFVVAG